MSLNAEVLNILLGEFATNEIQATAIYNYKREALAFIGSKFEGVYIGGEGWKNPRLEISRIKGNILAQPKYLIH
jgi:hypothetical protein